MKCVECELWTSTEHEIPYFTNVPRCVRALAASLAASRLRAPRPRAPSALDHRTGHGPRLPSAVLSPAPLSTRARHESTVSTRQTRFTQDSSCPARRPRRRRAGAPEHAKSEETGQESIKSSDGSRFIHAARAGTRVASVARTGRSKKSRNKKSSAEFGRRSSEFKLGSETSTGVKPCSNL